MRQFVWFAATAYLLAGGTAAIAQPIQFVTPSPLLDGEVSVQNIRVLRFGGGKAAPGQSYPEYSFSSPDFAIPGLGLGSGTSSLHAVMGGTPTVAGDYTFTLNVNDGQGNSASKVYTQKIWPMLQVVTKSPLPDGEEGAPYNFTVAYQGGIQPYTNFQCITRIPGFSCSQGVVTGKLTSLSGKDFTYSCAVQLVIDSQSGRHVDQCLDLTMRAGLRVANAALASGLVGTPYTAQFTAVKGKAPYTWAPAGAMPPGLTLSAAGLLSGTPTQAGTFPVVVKVTDANGTVTGTTLQLAVNPSGFAVATAGLAAGTVNAGYSQQLTAVNAQGPVTWTGTGLPNGLVVTASGLITGTPTQAGVFSVSVAAFDAVGPKTATRSYSLNIAGSQTSGVQVPGGVLVAGRVGNIYTGLIMASGGTGPYTYTFSNLPGGVAGSPNGALAGTPTTAGNYSVTVTATDSKGQAATGVYSLLVQASSQTPPAKVSLITPMRLDPAVIGRAYTSQFQAREGTPPYAFRVTGGQTPTGMTLGSDGAYGGTGSTEGDYTFSVTVTDSQGGTDTQNYQHSVFALPRVVNTTLTKGKVGTPYNVLAEVEGGSLPYRTKIIGGTLPNGVSYDNATRRFTGTPTAAGVFLPQLEIRDANDTVVVATLAIEIEGTTAPLKITSTSLTPGVTGTDYSQQLTSEGGKPPIVWKITGNVPPGLALDAATGTLAGQPALLGQQAVEVTATDAEGTVARTTLTLQVTQPVGLKSSLSSIRLNLPRKLGEMCGAPPVLKVAVTGPGQPVAGTVTVTGPAAGFVSTPQTMLIPGMVPIGVRDPGIAELKGDIVITAPGAATMSIPVTVSPVAPPVPTSEWRLGTCGPFDVPLNSLEGGIVELLPDSAGYKPLTIFLKPPVPPGTVTMLAMFASGEDASSLYQINTLRDLVDDAIGGQITVKTDSLPPAGQQIVNVHVRPQFGPSVSIPSVLYLLNPSQTPPVKLDLVNPRTVLGSTPDTDAVFADAITTRPSIGGFRPELWIDGEVRLDDGARVKVNVNPGSLVQDTAVPSTIPGQPASVRTQVGLKLIERRQLTPILTKLQAYLRYGEPGTSNLSTAVLDYDFPGTWRSSSPPVRISRDSPGQFEATNFGLTPIKFSTNTYNSEGPAACNPFEVTPKVGEIPARGKITLEVKYTGTCPAGTYQGEACIDAVDPSPTGTGQQPAGQCVLQYANTQTVPTAQKDPPNGQHNADACVASKLVVMLTRPVSQGTFTAGLPYSVEAWVVDNCGTPQGAADVVLYPGNGDAMFRLRHTGEGRYSGTWTPVRSPEGMTRTVAVAWSGALRGAYSVFTSVQPNPDAALVERASIVSGASFEGGRQRAPGEFVSIFGGNLASRTEVAQSLPLPTTLGGVSMTVANKPAPLLSVSPGQINAILPVGLPTGREHEVYLRRDGFELGPLRLPFATAQPAVFTRDQSGKGAGIFFDAQFRFLDATNPGQVGGAFIAYMSGLGEVEPPVAAGSAAPSSPLSRVKSTVRVTIGGVPVGDLIFAGLAPGLTGVYQVVGIIPQGVPAGSAVPVVVTVDGVSSPVVTMPIRP